MTLTLLISTHALVQDSAFRAVSAQIQKVISEAPQQRETGGSLPRGALGDYNEHHRADMSATFGIHHVLWSLNTLVQSL